MYDSRWQNIWRRRQNRCLCKVGKGQCQAACDHGLTWGHAGCRPAPAGRCRALHWRGERYCGSWHRGRGTLSKWPSHLNTLRQLLHLMRQIVWKKTWKQGVNLGSREHTLEFSCLWLSVLSLQWLLKRKLLDIWGLNLCPNAPFPEGWCNMLKKSVNISSDVAEAVFISGNVAHLHCNAL